MRGFRDFLTVSRANIQIASLPTALIGPALAARRLPELWDMRVGIFVLLFFVLLTFACNLNCLEDREVDARHKRSMSRAVASLGAGRVRSILAVEALAAVGLGVALAIITARGAWVVGAGVFAGLALAVVYSAPPWRLKKRGWLSPLPVMLGLYALPPAGGWFLVRGGLGAGIVVFAAGYALLMEGLTLVNTCEDHPEDEASGIRTLAHALGLRRALSAGAWLAGGGGVAALAAVVLISTASPGTPAYPGPVIMAVIALLAAFYLVAVASAVRVLRALARTEDPAAACKARSKLMPTWFLETRYPLLLIALLLKA